VTGATGVIGGPTVFRLVEAGHEVRAVSRREAAAAALRHAGAEPVTVDLFDADAVRDAVAGSDAIAHLATNVPPFPKLLRAKSWALHNRLRTEGTRNLVDAARAAGVGHIVKESITFMYEDGGDAWLDESSPLTATPGLMAPALEGEQIALELADAGGAAVALRFGLFYGGANRGTDEMLKIARWRGSMVAGKPSAYMSSIHANDVATAVVAALDAPSGIYNVCDDEPLTRRDALDAFSSAFGLGRLRTNPAWLMKLLAGQAAASLVASQRVSNRKFRDTTGWAPEYPSLREGWTAEHEQREVSHA
ncbi:MAG: NAD-dependent epimerase/dehydratase family protein, partial [Acidimicrobiia bacterium]